MKKGDWITVAVVTDEVDANLKKGYLEEAGIECIIEPLAFSAYPALNSFKINVPWPQFEQAEAVLSEIQDDS